VLGIGLLPSVACGESLAADHRQLRRRQARGHLPAEVERRLHRARLLLALAEELALERRAKREQALVGGGQRIGADDLRE
jgi:hypothetical protein